MTNPFIIRTASYVDALAIAPNLRKEDVAEIEAGSGRSPLQALTDVFRLDAGNNPVWVGVDDEGVGAIFGVTKLREGIGFPWMVATERLPRHAKQFLQECPRIIQLFHDYYQFLSGLVDCRNKVHIRWLQWCGFSVSQNPLPHGPKALPFYPFYKVSPTSV